MIIDNVKKGDYIDINLLNRKVKGEESAHITSTSSVAPAPVVLAPAPLFQNFLVYHISNFIFHGM